MYLGASGFRSIGYVELSYISSDEEIWDHDDPATIK